jgi:hypothetical protein
MRHCDRGDVLSLFLVAAAVAPQPITALTSPPKADARIIPPAFGLPVLRALDLDPVRSATLKQPIPSVGLGNVAIGLNHTPASAQVHVSLAVISKRFD